MSTSATTNWAEGIIGILTLLVMKLWTRKTAANPTTPAKRKYFEPGGNFMDLLLTPFAWLFPQRIKAGTIHPNQTLSEVIAP
jgi:hypothetical protein